MIFKGVWLRRNVKEKVLMDLERDKKEFRIR